MIFVLEGNLCGSGEDRDSDSDSGGADERQMMDDG